MTNSDKDSEERKKYQRTPNLFGDCEHITTMVVRLSRETEKFARYTICNQMVSQCFLLETNVRRAYRERDMDAKHRYIRYAMDAYEEIMSRHRQLIKIRAFVRRWAEFMGVEFNPGKEYFQPWCRGLEFVGGYIKKNRLYAGNRIIGNCETYIARMSTNDSSEVFAAHINSYFGLMRNHDSFSQRRRLMNLIPKERWKEIYFDRCLVCRARKNVKQLNDKEDDSKKCD